MDERTQETHIGANLEAQPHMKCVHETHSKHLKVTSMRKFFITSIASISVAVPLAFMTMTIVPVSGRPSSILTSPWLLLAYGKSVAWGFLICLLASNLTLLWHAKIVDGRWTAVAVMKNMLCASIASLVVAMPIALVPNIYTAWAASNQLQDSVDVQDLVTNPGFWIYYVKAVLWSFGAGLLASVLALVMTYRKDFLRRQARAG
ncbi:MAG: hypothetical protein LBP52_00810 [Burkholderiaceae bacterium]|nr:hypothetical protein [Burkholderiaceae bacterium]